MNYIFKFITKKSGKLAIDSSEMNNGYFFAGVAQPINKKLKLRISKGSYLATFDLKNDGTFDIFAFQDGSGVYRISLYENIYSNRYTNAGEIVLTVNLVNPNIGFLVPNQYINYNEVADVRNITKQLCSGKTKAESYTIIKNYIKQNYTYDFIKALKISKSMLPDIKTTIKKRSGICLDLAALAVAMFRLVGIPAKLMIGMADNNYHAWVEVIGSNGTVTYDPTVAARGTGKVKKYTVERYY